MIFYTSIKKNKRRIKNTVDKLWINLSTQEIGWEIKQKNSWIVSAHNLIAECRKSILHVGFSMGMN